MTLTELEELGEVPSELMEPLMRVLKRVDEHLQKGGSQGELERAYQNFLSRLWEWD